ncbi:MAG: Plasmid maintenance system antidote protein, XRE family [Candidatus Moranbacteria bacterium GW2011_GWE1_35_17]|nr:MAG: Plasmid maintenance system antidote protein, XRE family [Candidatus Moranbacteria bacterium GW2011_GWE1_35_17]KKP72930.1 MAG: Plasmid maintenance system antidote protein, XRE family [Candidatus Moranbacteria bacterium GW2011_GWE2_35_164]KKP83280.1 MAG: Plasmid maintenance system antidote protein, XRE family [Candidatus Moranbacteria bacterium GW2011_GWF1_35_5]KKP85262.1 MAG: Plasmid maintenance system antidote protein, XRE family [Candidatus Moranbacteria bacterium GW2011_GWF2_35_54]
MSKKELNLNNITGWESPVAIHPGEFLQDYIEEYNITQIELALRTGMSKKIINEIINGKNPITEAMAVKLSKIFPLSVEYWLNLQAGYEADLARLNQKNDLKKDVKHLTHFRHTYKELSKIGKVSNQRWIEKNFTKIVLELQKFLGVSSLGFINKTMEFAFRKYDRNNLDHYTLAAWLRLGDIKAQSSNVSVFDKQTLLNRLSEIKLLSTKGKEEYLKALEKIFAECGIVLAYVPYLENTHIQAATKWISPEKALIMIATCKGKDEGKFWFNLFHEIGHLLLHSKKEFHIDLKDYDATLEIEKEADHFAQKMLIADFNSVMKDLFKCSDDLENGIIKIAKENGISPAILAGRMTHEFKDNKRIYPVMSKFLQVRIDEMNV